MASEIRCISLEPMLLPEYLLQARLAPGSLDSTPPLPQGKSQTLPPGAPPSPSLPFPCNPKFSAAVSHPSSEPTSFPEALNPHGAAATQSLQMGGS